MWWWKKVYFSNLCLMIDTDEWVCANQYLGKGEPLMGFWPYLRQAHRSDGTTSPLDRLFIAAGAGIHTTFFAWLCLHVYMDTYTRVVFFLSIYMHVCTCKLWKLSLVVGHYYYQLGVEIWCYAVICSLIVTVHRFSCMCLQPQPSFLSWI